MTTPKIGHGPLPTRRVADSGSLEVVGDFCWQIGETGKRTLVLALPTLRGGNWTGAWCYSRWTIDHRNHCDAQWSWDGNEDCPTLSPSLHAVGVWHGWVKSGKLVEA